MEVKRIISLADDVDDGDTLLDNERVCPVCMPPTPTFINMCIVKLSQAVNVKYLNRNGIAMLFVDKHLFQSDSPR